MVQSNEASNISCFSKKSSMAIQFTAEGNDIRFVVNNRFLVFDNARIDTVGKFPYMLAVAHGRTIA